MAEHDLDSSVTQPFWDRSADARLTVESGDTVRFDCPEPCGQVTPEWTDAHLDRLNQDLVHALIGPVYVNGAQPGDTLQIEILRMEHRGWGWPGHLRGFGLLAQDFDFPYIHHWRLEGDRCDFGVNNIVVPCEPFCGCLGVAPQEPGRLNTMPPRRNGGNLDIRHLGVGAVAWLPVLVEGALFACGDCHAAQGDGEVSGTGIEAPMRASIRLTLRKDMKIDEPQFQAPSPLTRADTLGYHITTGHGPDLMANARAALRRMVDWLCRNRDLTPSQALVLCGAACDLRISQLVDAPNWLVWAYMPRSVIGV